MQVLANAGTCIISYSPANSQLRVFVSFPLRTVATVYGYILHRILHRFFEVFFTHRKIMLHRNSRRIAQPRRHGLNREFVHEFGFKTRPAILKNLFPRFQPCSLNYPACVCSKIRSTAAVASDDKFRPFFCKLESLKQKLTKPWKQRHSPRRLTLIGRLWACNDKTPLVPKNI